MQDLQKARSSPYLTRWGPPIKHICDPSQVLAVEREFTERLLHEVDERHLKPRELDLKHMIDDVLQRTSLLRDYRLKREQLDQHVRPYIALEPHHTWKDVQAALKMIAATQPQRRKRGRDRLDELVAVQCALLHDKYKKRDPVDRRFWRWTYKALHKEFKEYGVKDERSAKEHVERGRDLLADRRKNL